MPDSGGLPPAHPRTSMAVHEPLPDGQDARLEITDALLAVRSGARDATDRLLTRVYAELRAIAHRRDLTAERSGHTLCTTDLVHEAYLKLVDQERTHSGRAVQVFSVAARVMRANSR